MPSPTTAPFVRDAIVAVALAITLAGVYVVDATLFSGGSGENGGASQGAGVTIGKAKEIETVIGTETVTQPKPLRLAVTPPEFDNMGALLEKLGEGYRYDTISVDDLLDPDKLREYDVVFLTCGGYPESWLGERIGAGDRGAEVFRPNEEVIGRARESLRSYVGQGGILYASDWRLSIVQMSFEEFADRDEVKGVKQDVEAEIVHSGLREALRRPSVPLHFDKDGWDPALFTGKDVVVYLRGTFKTKEGNDLTKPLLVRIPFREGQIFFTAFHNEKQNSEEELQLLRYLVFTMVTSRVESKVRETLVQGGFSPQKQSLLSTSAGEPSVSMTYRCDKAGPLRFVLAFEDRGAVLQLKVEGPGGRSLEQTGTSTLQIDVPDAQPGEWKYTITAKQVPFENFPFTCTVGQK
jgi:hypothetical protein